METNLSNIATVLGNYNFIPTQITSEVLVVSIFIITTLVFLFTQFINLKKSYDNILVYNTVDGLYGTKNINDYLNTSNLLMN